MKKKPKDEIDELMAAEGIGGNEDIDALMEAEGIVAPKQTMVPGARAAAERQLDDREPVTLQTDPEPKTGLMQRMFGRMSDVPMSASPGVGVPASADQAKARYHGMSNILTLGVADRIRDASDGGWSKDDRDRIAKENPVDEAIGGATGALIGGAPKIVDAAAGGATRAALPFLSGSRVGRVAQGAAAGALSGGVQAKAMGQDWREGADLGGILGGLGSTVSEAADAGAKWLRSKGWIGKYAKAKDSGLMSQVENDAEAGKVSKDPVGQASSAATARDKILGRLDSTEAADRGALTAAKQRLAPENADRGAITDLLDDMVANNYTKEGAEVVDGLSDEISAISKKLGAEPSNADVEAILGTMEEAAQFGAPSRTKEQIRTGKIWSALREGLTDELSDARGTFHQAQTKRESMRDLLTGSEDGVRESKLPGGEVTGRANDLQAMGKRVGRLGDDSVEGAWANQRLEKLRAYNDPEINSALDELEAYKAWAATRFGAPVMPGNLNKVLDRAVQWGTHNANAAGAQVGLPAAEAIRKPAAAASKRAGSAIPYFLRRKDRK